MTRTGAGEGRARIVRWLQYALAVPLAGYVLWSLRSQTATLADLLHPQSLLWLTAAAAMLAANQVIMALRQVVLLRHFGTQVSLGLVCRITFAGLFANNFMPAGIGHDLVRIVYLRGHGGQTGASLGGLVLIDRFLGLMGLSVLAMFGYGLLSNLHPEAVPGEAGRLLLYATLLPLPLGMAIMALRHGSTFDRITQITARLPLGAKVQELLGGMRQFSTRKRVLLLALVLSALGHLCTVLGVAAISWGLYGATAALGSALVSPLVFFASSVPVTPSNLGWTETVAEAAWRVFGMQGGMVIFLIWRVVTMAVSLYGCATYLNLRGRTGPRSEAS